MWFLNERAVSITWAIFKQFYNLFHSQQIYTQPHTICWVQISCSVVTQAGLFVIGKCFCLLLVFYFQSQSHSSRLRKTPHVLGMRQNSLYHPILKQYVAYQYRCVWCMSSCILAKIPDYACKGRVLDWKRKIYKIAVITIT